MIRNKKTYGFTIAVKELRETVPNIWRYASAFKRMNNITSQGMWEMFVEKPKEEPKDKLPKDDPKYKKPLPQEILNSEPGTGALPDIDPENMEGENYNMCHFWSNFEIVNLSWYRSKEYNDFFEMMDRSGGFWMERVSLRFQESCPWLTCYSGVMHPFTRSLQAFSSVLQTSTISVTLAIDTPRSSTVQQMHLRDSCPGFPISKRLPRMRRHERKKTTTGRIQTHPRRMVSAVAADAILTSWTSKAKKGLALPNGWRLLEAGLHLGLDDCCLLLFCITFRRAFWEAPTYTSASRTARWCLRRILARPYGGRCYDQRALPDRLRVHCTYNVPHDVYSRALREPSCCNPTRITITSFSISLHRPSLQG